MAARKMRGALELYTEEDKALMKLRKAWLLLPILLVAAAAHADPIKIRIPAGNSASSGSLNFTSIQMITSMDPARRTGQAQGSLSAGPTIPAPEPATLALFGSGLIAIATVVRRRSRRTDTTSAQK